MPDATCLYIGKAANTTLRQRVRLLIDYGSGKPVGHQGGRYLWQIEGSDQLLIAWLQDPLATFRENEPLTAFAGFYGVYPFANIAGPRG